MCIQHTQLKKSTNFIQNKIYYYMITLRNRMQLVLIITDKLFTCCQTTITQRSNNNHSEVKQRSLRGQTTITQRSNNNHSEVKQRSLRGQTTITQRSSNNHSLIYSHQNIKLELYINKCTLCIFIQVWHYLKHLSQSFSWLGVDNDALNPHTVTEKWSLSQKLKI